MQKVDKKSADFRRMVLQNKLNYELKVSTIEAFIFELKEILEENQLDEENTRAIFFCFKKIEDSAKNGASLFADHLKIM